ncbi:MAG TPA: S8 family serine peptidase [Pyrinomonadaceae bacterium]
MMSLKPRSHRTLLLLSLFTALCFVALVFGVTPSSQAISDKGVNPKSSAPTVGQQTEAPDEQADLAAFRKSVGGEITPVIIELRGEPGVIRKVASEQSGQKLSFDQIVDYSLELVSKQDGFRASLAGRGVRALMREADVKQVDGSVRHVQYRFTYLLNGFVAYIAKEDLARLRALPEVMYVEEIQPVRFHLDKGIDYSLGTQTNTADRRAAVYGATQEFTPATDDAAHPEKPRATKIDGFEGQNMNVAVIDTGVDWRHPMFGGTGLTTPKPRVAGQPENPADNKKIIYYYVLSPGDITDDFGHGTHVASCAAGYVVDGTTPRRVGYGTGTSPDGTTPGTGIGPTPNGVQLFGTAPQARIMAYKICGPANNCSGDSELAMEDAASPFTLVGAGDGAAVPTAVAKPVADVINLSLGDTAGDPAGSSARAANNAALAGSIVVASAGNAGPGAGTTGAPSSATLAISVAATLDPGSTPAADVLAPAQILLETCAGQPPASCAVPGPPPEKGAASNANTPQPNERQGMRIFPVAGGGALPEGSLSAHYVYVDNPNTTPTQVRNRIALVRGGTGTFFNIVNAVAAQQPAAIILVDDRESLTALVVAGNIPVFNANTETSNYLINRMREGDTDANNDGRDDVAPGTVSQFPLRLAESVTLATFQPGMAGFSSRGPNDFDGRFRTVKPDVAAPGVGITGAATPEGLPDETIGMATPIGYITVNGTSFSAPITAGAMAVIRQRVREQLNLDSTNTAAVDYRTKRFDTVTVSRALLMNTATNLRSGLGVAQGDGANSVASINDMGAGLINVAGALDAKAIMVAPTLLQTTPREFTPPAAQPSPTPLQVLIPSASFGTVPVVGVNSTVTRTHEVILRDVTGGTGSGTYSLTFQNNRFADKPGFLIDFTAADGTTPITSITIPSGGQATFRVRVVADGQQITADPTEFQWYVTATQNSSGRKLRMPFYYRAVRATFPNIAAPNQTPPTGTEQPAPPTPPGCPVDTNGNYQVNWTYTGPPHVGFRVQEATRSQEIFFDNADEPLVAGENSKWRDALTPPQWTSQASPGTGSLAYFVPDAADQNEPLTMKGTIALPAGGATLSFVTYQDTEQDFDFAHVDVSTDAANNFVSFNTVASFSGFFSGTRFIDLSPYAGQTIKLRFRMTSDLAVPAPGWYVEDIRVNTDDFSTIADTGPAVNSHSITGRPDKTYSYRIAALYTNPNPAEAGTTITGPYSNLRCVTVQGSGNSAPTTPTLSINDVAVTEGNSGTSNATFTVSLSAASASQVTVAYTSADGTATSGSDYQSVTGTLTFAPGDTTKTINVPIFGDTTVEANETFFINLSSPTNATLSDNQGTGTIVNDDSPPPPPPPPPTVQLGAGSYTVSEGAGRFTLTVTRSNAANAATVDYATSDTAGLAECSTVNGIASQRCDYTIAVGRLRFAAGETSKVIDIPVIDDVYADGNESFTFTLSNPSGDTLGAQDRATLTITDNDSNSNAPNPIDTTDFFIRQHYLDFLLREPEPGGFQGWRNILNNCPQGDTSCDRIEVSSAFYRSEEFQTSGYFVFRVYVVSLGQNPRYAEFMPDLSRVSGYQTDAEKESNRVAFVAEFMSRSSFKNHYDSKTQPRDYVDELERTAGVTLSNKEQLIADLEQGKKSRAEVLRAVADSPEVIGKYFNQAFVVMEYFGYLRRDPDILYLEWIRIMNESNGNYRIMVNGFLNSTEYRSRFGKP